MRLAESLMPYSIENFFTDAEVERVLCLINEYKAAIPGLSSTLPARRNLWGDSIEIPSGFGPDKISPVYTSGQKKDPAGDEIVRLGKLGLPVPGHAARNILGADPEQATKLGMAPSPLKDGIELTDSEYDQYVRLAGNELKKKS